MVRCVATGAAHGQSHSSGRGEVRSATPLSYSWPVTTTRYSWVGSAACAASGRHA
jgi:hypothetical protein